MDVPAGYEPEVDGFNIINTQKSTEVFGEKTWNEVDKRYRPESVEVQLLANGEKEQTAEVSEETDWVYTFKDLAKYDKNGEEIKYTVEEVDVPKGYDTEVDGSNIINTQKSTEVSGEKSWNEVDKRYRPESVTIQLFANNDKEDTIEVSEETEWTYEFTDLAKYDKSGEKIEYTVEELDVPAGYDSEVDGFNVINTQKSTEVSGEKSWNEVDERYRPESVEIQLLANGEKEQTAKVSEETDWTYEFTDLAKYDQNGKKIDYTVQELNVPAGYDSEVDGYDIINIQKSTEITGEKIWLDGQSKDRPEAIEVGLFVNDENEPEETIEVTENDKWTYKFTELAKYDQDGKEIDYTVKELNVPTEYEVTIDEFDITNTKLIDISGVKVWKDSSSKDRPESIEIVLLQNGEAIDSVKITAEDDWKFVFTNLKAFDNKDQTIEYTVEEVEVDGYDSEITGDMAKGFTVTNTETPDEPEAPEKSEDSDKDDSDKEKDKEESEDDGSLLPKTGETSYTTLAIVLLIIGIGLIAYNRSWSNKKE